MIKFNLINLGKERPYFNLEIWNGEVRTKSVQINVGITLEELDNLIKKAVEVRDQISINGGIKNAIN